MAFKVPLNRIMSDPWTYLQKGPALPVVGGKPKKDKQTPKRTEAKAKRKKKTKSKSGERTPVDTKLG